jgi:hypothetical protein
MSRSTCLARVASVLLRAALVGATGAPVFACEFATDLDSLKDQVCPPQQKHCKVAGVDVCASWDNTDTGCNDKRYATSCEPCGAGVVHATTTCSSAHTCIWASCDPSWLDCNMDPGDGCETNVETSASHCGSCENACAVAASTSADVAMSTVLTCSASHCQIDHCENGYQDCDQVVANGCEVHPGDPEHCGSCMTACTAGQRCVGGACM